MCFGTCFLGQWLHLAGTFDGASVKLYVNGAEHFSVAHSGTFASEINPILIGGNANDASGNPNQLFNGNIDDVQIYDRALMAAEVQTLYQGAPPSSDDIPPSVSVTSPKAGQVSGTIAVSASASDNFAIAGVRFKTDGVNIGAEDTSAPYSVMLTTATFGNGSHVITAAARDAAGNTTTSTAVNITISNTSTRIMPLGDSITDGFNVPGGYRIGLWSKFTAGNQHVDFVGSLLNGPASLGDKDHEGHSSWRIDQIAANTDAWLDTFNPDIVLLKIGTNDMTQAFNLASAPARLDALVEQITTRRPTLRLIMASITPLSDSTFNQRAVAYNSHIPGMVSAKAALGQYVSYVDMYNALTLNDLADGVHPATTGYSKMANAWYTMLGTIP